MLTASENSTGPTAGSAPQDRLAALSPNSLHRTVHSTHSGLLEDVRPAAASVRVITEVLSAVRASTPLPSR